MDAADAELVQLFQGGMEWLTLLVLLAVVLQLWGWAADRGVRPADRGRQALWPLVLVAFGLAAVLRVLQTDWPVAVAIVAAVLVAGLLSRIIEGFRLGLPAMLLAALLGLGHVLSALVLSVAGLLVLLISRGTR